MMQVYGLAAMVGFLDHNGMLASAVEKLSTTEAMTKDSGALTSLSLYTSKLANPSMEEPGRTFANYIRRFTNIPDTSDLDSNPRFMVFLPSIGGFKFKSTQFFLQHIFDSRGRLLEVFDRVPAFGWFLILSLMRLQIWFFLKSDDNNDSALEMLTELQDLNYRFYLIANTEPEHRLISSLIGEVSSDMSDYNFVDFVGPIVGSGNVLCGPCPLTQLSQRFF
ncbi:hypothetical protein FRC12_011838 [Ceratobasidium sp. 428]|nr:hypothetical protein FRC12_011838 [Ceratobasidium sp. 428]